MTLDIPRDIPIAIGLGSNLGDRALSLRTAIRDLAPYMTVIAVSPFYETPAAYVTDQPPFLNAALTAMTALSPLALLWSLKYVEDALGRQPTFRYGPRLIDLDILSYDNRVVREADLVIPHPRLGEREFVLRPFVDIAPDWKHPETGISARDMLEKIPPSPSIRRFTDETDPP